MGARRRWRRWRQAAVVALVVAAALAAPAPPPPGGPRPLRAAGPCGPDRALRPAVPPMRGPDVQELQERLRELGLYSGPVDGAYAGATVAAVRALQARAGRRPTGEVDAATWGLLAEGTAAREALPDQPPPFAGPLSLEVDLATQTLTVFAGGRPVRRYPVAIGKPWSPSPPGEWRIVEKAYEAGGAFGTRWLGLDVPWGNYGIHGTNRPWSIGRPASAGCIRMHNHHIEEIFDWVQVGTLVTIKGDLPAELWGTYRPGSTGLGVVALQVRLREAGFPPGRADGRFGERTAAAVRALQSFYGLPVDGTAGAAELYLLGLRRPEPTATGGGAPPPAPAPGGGTRLGRAP